MTLRIAKRLAAACLLGLIAPVSATPFLQLDIGPGIYVGGTEQSTITTADTFTLYALVHDDVVTAADYFLSIAVLPTSTVVTNFGSFAFGGTTYNNTNMTFGTPPIDATANPYLAGHGVFETSFLELDFMFGDGDVFAADYYNTQPTSGDGSDTPLDHSGTGLLVKAFTMDVSGLFPGFELHFDLYDTQVKNNGNITVDSFAPFSHDAATGPGPIGPSPGGIPEPATALLLGLGLVGMHVRRRRTHG